MRDIVSWKRRHTEKHQSAFVFCVLSMLLSVIRPYTSKRFKQILVSLLSPQFSDVELSSSSQASRRSMPRTITSAINVHICRRVVPGRASGYDPWVGPRYMRTRLYLIYSDLAVAVVESVFIVTQ